MRGEKSSLWVHHRTYPVMEPTQMARTPWGGNFEMPVTKTAFKLTAPEKLIELQNPYPTRLNLDRSLVYLTTVRIE